MIFKAQIENIGKENCKIDLRFPDGMKTFSQASDFSGTNEQLKASENPFSDILRILNFRGLTVDGIGHRVVHGGEKYSSSVLVDNDVKQVLCSVTGPSHIFRISNNLPHWLHCIIQSISKAFYLQKRPFLMFPMLVGPLLHRFLIT